jgi:hypothetical protein
MIGWLFPTYFATKKPQSNDQGIPQPLAPPNKPCHTLTSIPSWSPFQTYCAHPTDATTRRIGFEEDEVIGYAPCLLSIHSTHGNRIYIDHSIQASHQPNLNCLAKSPSVSLPLRLTTFPYVGLRALGRSISTRSAISQRYDPLRQRSSAALRVSFAGVRHADEQPIMVVAQANMALGLSMSFSEHSILHWNRTVRASPEASRIYGEVQLLY